MWIDELNGNNWGSVTDQILWDEVPHRVSEITTEVAENSGMIGYWRERDQ